MTISIDKIQTPIQITQRPGTIRQQSNNYRYIPKPYIKVARGMEKQYARFMIDQMNKTIKKSHSNSNGENYYNSLLDNQRVETMVKRQGGLGLQKVILSQIYPDTFRNKFAYEQYEGSIRKRPKNKMIIIGPTKSENNKREVIVKTVPLTGAL